MGRYADNGRTRPVHMLLSAYLGVIVIALLAVTTGPEAWPSFSRSNASGDSRTAHIGGSPSDRATVAFGEAASEGFEPVEADNPLPGDDGSARTDIQLAADADGDAEAAAPDLAQIDFDLGAATASEGSRTSPSRNRVEVTKPLYFEGAELGSLTITIDQNARLFAQRSDLQTLLQSDEAAARRIGRIGADGLVSFQRLREFGVSLRYDPISDRIVLQPD